MIVSKSPPESWHTFLAVSQSRDKRKLLTQPIKTVSVCIQFGGHDISGMVEESETSSGFIYS